MAKSHLLTYVASFCLALGVFNVHMPDLGENYVARNLLAWAAVGLFLPVIWLGVLRRHAVAYRAEWLIGLLVPAAGSVLVLALNMMGGYSTWQPGHLLVPFMLLGFACFTLGLMQLSLSDKQIVGALLVVLIAFLPQYGLYFFARHMSETWLTQSFLTASLYKPFAGFHQYNLFGSFLASVLVLIGFVASRLAMAKASRALLYGLAFLLALEVPIMNSKAGFLGLVGGLVFLLLHFYVGQSAALVKKRFAVFLAIFPAAYLVVALLQAVLPEAASSSADWRLDGTSVSSRSTMWVIAWRSFLESPLFGHGLGSYVKTYYTHFARYGLSETLAFYPHTTMPHNLILHVLSETGLIGAAVLLGPLFYLAFVTVRHNANRWLVMALAFPVLLHTQTEYPYMSSGLHYIIVAVALALGMRYRATDEISCASFSPRRNAKTVYAGICLLALCLVTAALHLTLAYTQASEKYYRSRLMTFEGFLAYSYNPQDAFHPFFERRLRAITDLRAINMALEEGRRDFLGAFGVTYLEQNLLPHYETRAIWFAGAHVYAMLGEDEKLQRLLRRIDQFDPPFADSLRRKFDDLPVSP